MVLEGPEELATVDEEFGLGAMGHEIDRATQDEVVGPGEFGVEGLHIVLEGAGVVLEAIIALGAGLDMEVGQADLFEGMLGGLVLAGPGVADALDNTVDEEVGVTSRAWTGG